MEVASAKRTPPLVGRKHEAKPMKAGEVTQLGLPHRASPRRRAAAVTPQWALRGGRLRHPGGRHAKGGGCYRRDAARASAARSTRRRKARTGTRPRRPAIQPLSESRGLARGKQGPWVPSCWAGTGAGASMRRPGRPRARAHTARARAPAPGPRSPPLRPAARPAAARSPTGPRRHPRGPPGRPRATPPISARARSGGASRAPGPGR